MEFQEDALLRATAETRKNAANDAFHKDDYAKAINLYTEGIEVNCNDKDLNAKLYNNRALAHYHLGNYHDCLSDIKAATALQPSYLKAIFRGANTCVKLKQFDEAIVWCDKGLAIDPNNQKLLEIRSRSEREREKLESHGGDEAEITEEDSGSRSKPLDCTSIADARKSAGNDAFRKDDFVKAINLYTEGIEVKCNEEDLNAKLYNNRASAHYHLENYQDCLSDIKAATALKPYYLKAIIRGAKACLKLKRFEEGIDWCDQGLAIDKENQDLLEIKSRSVVEREKLLTQEGDKEAKQGGDSGTNPKPLDSTTIIAETRKNDGNDAFLNHDFVKAVNLYTEGIEVKCKDEDLNAKLYNNRASAHYHLENYHDCLSDLKAATALQPSYLKAIIRGANTCLKLKQFEEAIIWCEKGLTIDEDNQDLLEIKTCSVIEREKILTHEGDKAAKEEGDSRTNQTSLDCTPVAETHKNAGNDAFLSHDFVKAVNLYTEGIKLKCKDEDLKAKLFNNRASAHYHLGNYPDCLSDVKAATALQPSYLKAIIRGENESDLNT